MKKAKKNNAVIIAGSILESSYLPVFSVVSL